MLNKLMILYACLIMSGCSSHYSAQDFTFESGEQFVLMPIVNHSNTPLAGEKAENILASLWVQKGLPTLQKYPRTAAAAGELPDLDDFSRLLRAQQWLETTTTDYYISGAIQEWRYKSNFDTEPTVGITIDLHRKQDKTIIWSATSARSGWDRESLTATAQQVIAKIIADIKLNSQ